MTFSLVENNKLVHPLESAGNVLGGIDNDIFIS